jgi:hypothetical protein
VALPLPGWRLVRRDCCLAVDVKPKLFYFVRHYFSGFSRYWLSVGIFSILNFKYGKK